MRLSKEIKMFKKVLVANRGEIAVQIIRAIQELDMTAVAVYSSADQDALFVRLADESICIGGPQANDSYLNMTNIISAANLTGCDAIHPGYGFLSENPEFAELCQECGIKFVGPDPETIKLMGNKSNARETMKKADVPVVPGSDGLVTSLEMAQQVAANIGFPVMLKAADGGGGKGIRRVKNATELDKAYTDTKREAGASFSDDSVYLEKIVEDAKHIEMQVLCDEEGNVVYLPERDCSLQRSNQKVLEESPCILVSDSEREYLGSVVVKACRAMKYVNTGTFEFLMDKNHDFYFMEMNTRLQVEHTITEEITGIEIIKEQIKIAEGQSLTIRQNDVQINGHAIECRINAEVPEDNFRPSAGKIDYLYFPEGSTGVRIDTGIDSKSSISPFYDSMIAKLIVHMPTRVQAITKMKSALKEFKLDGIQTNRNFLLELMNDDHFQNGDFNTKYIETDFLSEGSHHAEKV